MGGAPVQLAHAGSAAPTAAAANPSATPGRAVRLTHAATTVRMRHADDRPAAQIGSASSGDAPGHASCENERNPSRCTATTADGDDRGGCSGGRRALPVALDQQSSGDHTSRVELARARRSRVSRNRGLGWHGCPTLSASLPSWTEGRM